jgi:hypothetical protein
VNILSDMADVKSGLDCDMPELPMGCRAADLDLGPAWGSQGRWLGRLMVRLPVPQVSIPGGQQDECTTAKHIK